MSEQAAFRDITHKEFDHRRELVNRLIESRGSLRGRGTPNGLPQVGMRLGVIELDGFDPAKIIVITGKLGVARRCWERSLRHQLVGLVVQTVVKVVAEQSVDKRCLRLVIVTERGCPLSSEE